MTITDVYDPAMPDAPENWMSRADAADRLGVSAQTVDYYAVAGKLRRWQNPTTKRVWVLIADVDRVKAEREAVPE